MTSTRPPAAALAERTAPARRTSRRRTRSVSWLVVRLFAALYLFIGALQVMKVGAAGLGELLQGGLFLHNAGSTFGLGWLGAMLVLSGSPVAASALAFVAAGTISPLQGFTMLTGSRLGAAFVVLLVSVVYALRGGAGYRKKPVAVAILAFGTTALIYLPGAALGLVLLGLSPLSELQVASPVRFNDLLELVYGGLLARIEGVPALPQFGLGLAALLLAFRLFDTVLPEPSAEQLERSRQSWLERPWPMFGLGCLVALVTMSVSVALTVLVPLVARDHLRREQIIPYIMGANITTLGDTLLAAFLLDSAAAVRIVLIDLLCVALVSVLLLASSYEWLRRALLDLQRWTLRSHAHLAGFTATLFLVPIAIVLLAGLAD